MTFEQYERMRQRFIDKFYYGSRVAEYLYPSLRGDRVKFADQTIYMGMALAVFATEIAIEGNGRKCGTDSRTLLRGLLNGFDELDLKANERYGASGGLNGLFVRDDISGPEDPRLAGRFRYVDSDWQGGVQRQAASPSGDQIFGMMFGLLCVVRFADDVDLAMKAREISSRLFEYARSTYFILRLPNGESTKRGSDMRWLASLSHDVNQAITGDDLMDETRVWYLGRPRRLYWIASFWESFWVPMIVSGLVEHLNSFAIHLLLMALGPVDTWSQRELECVAFDANHHLAVLQYCVLHGTRPSIQRDDVSQILHACPEAGPRADADAATGWSHDNRWIRCTNIFEPTAGSEHYNGLDWMVLHNFHQLANYNADAVTS